ncbi:helix-turn-helix transcriptional regulator [Variovorax paradoxus]|uniref:helix-turn-helix transcriptional regulator n=1 Tax=Variovorax paradoxus TaxID=34073 RepID=UPI0027830461|nr:AraC family transcriptional regulator [Variovorax paradoxus]MDP9932779.1 AraC family transcriptional regulator [Variovorax paradoxus]
MASLVQPPPNENTVPCRPGDFETVSSAHFLNQAPWQVPYEYGTVCYRAAERAEERLLLDQNILGVELTPGIVRVQVDSGRKSSNTVLAGALYFVRAGSVLHVQKEQPIDFVFATIDTENLNRIWDELGGSGSVPHLEFNIEDSLIQELAWKLRKAFCSDVVDVGLVASDFVRQAITRLVQKEDGGHRRFRYKLAPYQLRSALEFINENLASSLKVEMLANDLARCSGFYFAHAFTEMLGCSPHQYILDRRLCSAHELIRLSKCSLAEIAYTVGFSSQAHMTTTFCKRFGVTPGRLRQSVRTTTHLHKVRGVQQIVFDADEDDFSGALTISSQSSRVSIQ